MKDKIIEIWCKYTGHHPLDDISEVVAQEIEDAFDETQIAKRLLLEYYCQSKRKYPDILEFSDWLDRRE